MDTATIAAPPVTPTGPQIAIWDIRQTEPFRDQILHAIRKTHERVGSRYTAEQEYDHLKTRVIEHADITCLRLFFDKSHPTLTAGAPGQFCGLMTLDSFHDILKVNACCISRAWCLPGMGRTLWQQARPMVLDWAKQHDCRRLQLMTMRDTAWYRWLRREGWQMRETVLEVELWDN